MQKPFSFCSSHLPTTGEVPLCICGVGHSAQVAWSHSTRETPGRHTFSGSMFAVADSLLGRWPGLNLGNGLASPHAVAWASRGTCTRRGSRSPCPGSSGRSRARGWLAEAAPRGGSACLQAPGKAWPPSPLSGLQWDVAPARGGCWLWSLSTVCWFSFPLIQAPWGRSPLCHSDAIQERL